MTMFPTWVALDPFNQPRGPFRTDELPALAMAYGDVRVAQSSDEQWRRVSEVLPPSPTRQFNARRLVDRHVQELVGFARGILADGHVADTEIVALRDWLAAREEALTTWPVNVVAERVGEILRDRKVEEHERADFALLLQAITGGEPAPQAAATQACRLPCDDPAPFVEYVGRVFCVTGVFAFGARPRVEAAIRAEGGQVEPRVTRRIDFLLLGAVANPEWAHGAWGRKVEQALELRAAGARIAIVAEQDWVTSLTA